MIDRSIGKMKNFILFSLTAGIAPILVRSGLLVNNLLQWKTSGNQDRPQTWVIKPME